MATNDNEKEKEEFNALCEKYIGGLYQGMSGFISYQPGEKEANAKEDIFLTYGEILYPSVNELIEYAELGPEDVFCDLGSGVGKVALQFFLRTQIKRSFGVEASQARYGSAAVVLDKVKKEFPELFKNRQLEYQQGNFLKSNLEGVTVMYTCSTCFGPELMTQIGELIDNTPSIRCVFSMKPIPCALPFDKTLDVVCTWDKTKCHVYRR